MERKKILLVDDSEAILMLERLFLQSDYDISIARDGPSGIARARADQPDLVILDLIMPGMTGINVCRALRANMSTRRTPIVMVTSHREPGLITAGYRSGCTAYLTKPIYGPALLATVKSCLEDSLCRGPV